MRSFALAGLLAIELVLSAPVSAATFIVDTTTDATDAVPGDGICADAGSRCTLRAAIQETNSLPGADTIELPVGEFILAIGGTDEDLSATGDLDITDDVTVRGAGPETTIIDGGALDRVIDIHSGDPARTVSLAQLTVRNGLLVDGVFDGGAGLRVAASAHVLLEDIDIRNNDTMQSTHGVAIDTQGCIEGDRVRILDNRNRSKVLFPQGTVYVHGVEQRGGRGACLKLSDSQISGNSAGRAGAVFADRSSVTLRRTLISDNEAQTGAGAMNFNMGVSTLLENVTVSGNRGAPGAIMNDGFSRLEIVNSTITGNGPGKSGAQVGGILDVHGGFGMTFLSNTILAGNIGSDADDCLNGNSVGGGNIIGDAHNCFRFNAHPTDQLGVVPDLEPLTDNGGLTHTHWPGADAIDRGQAAKCPATDQRGSPRPMDGDGDGVQTCDVGAVEVDGEPPNDDLIFVDGFEIQR